MRRLKVKVPSVVPVGSVCLQDPLDSVVDLLPVGRIGREPFSDGMVAEIQRTSGVGLSLVRIYHRAPGPGFMSGLCLWR